jgi:lipoprotein-releasing system ATP-binding protein
MIIARELHKHYGQLHVLKGVNLNIKQGEIVSIVGASGAGKTTLLQLLGTLDKPSKHEMTKLEINKVNIASLSDNLLSKFRNEQLGFIFQFHQLLPEFTALENVCIPAYIKGTSKENAELKGLELLEFLGLKDRINNKPNELSGGEQ